MARPRTAKNSQSRQALHCATCQKAIGGPTSIESLLEEFGKATLTKITAEKFALSGKTRDDKQKSTQKSSFKGVKVMAGKYGVKNIADFLVLGKVFVVSLIRAAKEDGFQMTDVFAVLKSPELETALTEALKDMDLVPAEAKELDVFDGLSLGSASYDMVKEVLAEVKK